MILLNNLLRVCAEFKENSSAQDYLKQAIDLAKIIELDDVSAFHINLGMSFFKKKAFDKAKASYSQAGKLQSSMRIKKQLRRQTSLDEWKIAMAK